MKGFAFVAPFSERFVAPMKGEKYVDYVEINCCGFDLSRHTKGCAHGTLLAQRLVWLRWVPSRSKVRGIPLSFERPAKKIISILC